MFLSFSELHCSNDEVRKDKLRCSLDDFKNISLFNTNKIKRKQHVLISGLWGVAFIT